MGHPTEENLGRDMNKLKENVHAIQLGCQICGGAHLDKGCPLNGEVKSVEEVKYGEFGRPFPNNNRHDGSKHCGGRGGGVGSNSGVGEGKEEFIGGIGGGSFAKRSMVAKDGLEGDGFVVDGGRSPLAPQVQDGEDDSIVKKGKERAKNGALVIEADLSGRKMFCLLILVKIND
ncbi:hypothetical protein Tco_0822408 [Tanacetum coccineum]|uniref:Uncharacterized protein n=1 Tax=Tanacetum coccineum TaxID=301880 RepID=A0ABQ5AJV5_9ASTR